MKEESYINELNVLLEKYSNKEYYIIFGFFLKQISKLITKECYVEISIIICFYINIFEEESVLFISDRNIQKVFYIFENTLSILKSSYVFDIFQQEFSMKVLKFIRLVNLWASKINLTLIRTNFEQIN